MQKFLAGAVLLAVVHLAHAHTRLASSTPGDQAALEQAPREIVLEFSEPVRLTALTLLPADGARHELGPLPSASSARFAIAVPDALADGAYAVAWRALSADTHVVTGDFAFTVGSGQAAAPRSSGNRAEHGAH